MSASRAAGRNFPAGQDPEGGTTPPAVRSAGVRAHRATSPEATLKQTLCITLLLPVVCGSEVKAFKFRKLIRSPGWPATLWLPLERPDLCSQTFEASREGMGREKNEKGGLKGEPCCAGPGGKKRGQEKKMRIGTAVQAEARSLCDLRQVTQPLWAYPLICKMEGGGEQGELSES